ncbi:hypothetical protein HFO98_25665 [Rhizobium leguminosarum]|uniref:hypothetical protein n=1 Tax=Rhizobium leguminosarum TaxID=384 RepID=UPI0021BC2A9E|nr:hypothetical protein [Rhizobium leguminosarum]MBY5411783.1 hypothetical protein [Rhizobium leguminosarum]
MDALHQCECRDGVEGRPQERPPRSMRPFCVGGITGAEHFELSGLRHFRIADVALADLAETPRNTDIGPDSLVTQWRASGAELLATEPFVQRFG